MAKGQRAKEIEVGEDLEFQQRSWVVQRIGWIVIALVIIAALSGLFGAGPLSQATVGNEGDALRLVYDRFERMDSPATLDIYLGPEVANEGQVRLWISRDYLKGASVQQVTPPPEQVEIGADRLIYTFRVADAARPALVTFDLEMAQSGRLVGQMGLTDEAPLSFWQFVYP
jgi:hypothetical protein